MLQLLTTLSFLVLATLGGSAPLIVCPASLAAGQVYYCFLSVSDQTAAPSSLELVQATGSSTALASALPDVQNPGMYRLAVPSSVAAGKYVVQLPASSAFSALKAEVSVAAQSKALLLEADRALYKPGHTARFRALALSMDQLLPQGATKLNFEVVSPEGFKLISTSGITDSTGVVLFDFPIATEPLLGSHTARVSLSGVAQGGAAATKEASFTVEEYVLPRFEVNLSVDQSHLSVGSSYFSVRSVSSQSSSSGSTGEKTTVSGEVSAKFTFGEAVVGLGKLTVWSPIMSWETGYQSDSKSGGGSGGGTQHRALATITVELTAGRPTRFEMPVATNQLSSGRNLMIEAEVTYPVTGEVQKGTSSLPVLYSGNDLQVHLSFEDGQKVFRPGLPSRVRVELTKPDGRAPSQSELQASGEMKLRTRRTTVVYQSGGGEPDSRVLDPVSFVNGVLVLDIPTSVEDRSCCNMQAPRSTREEYRKAVGCCVQSMNMYVEVKKPGVSYPQRLYAAREKTSDLCASRAYSPQGNYLAIHPPTQGSSGDWTAHLRSTIDLAQLKTAEYMILRGGALSSSGTAKVTSTSSTSQYFEASLPVSVPASLSGELQLLVIVRPADGAIALSASAKFTRTLQLPFSLSASFSVQEAKPGAGLSLEIEAGPSAATGSVVTGVHAFITSLDRSAELLGQRAAISGDAILASLQAASAGAAPTPVAPKPWRDCHLFGVDVMVAAELPEGMKIAQDTSSPKTTITDDEPFGPELHPLCPRPLFSGTVCWGGGGDMVMEMAAMDEMDDGGPVALSAARSGTAKSAGPPPPAPAPATSVTVRKFFPETWLWTDIALSSSSGKSAASLAVTAPDTITTWSLDAFATSPEGVSAMRAEVPLKVFKPFFIEVRMPYASVRGEDLEVTFAVFNYAKGSNTLTASLDIALPAEIELANGAASIQLRVPENGANSTRVRLRPKALGTWRITATARSSSSGSNPVVLTDAIQRVLRVRAEGIPMSETQNVVLNLAQPGVARENIRLNLPTNAVNGSGRLSVLAVGDLLGPSISGLDRLLRIPTGCGEQNMITLAPNVYVAKYLTAMAQLRADIRQRIVNNIVVGYGRELTYRHADGSFSAFGKSDESGSTWLTAFVLKTFAEVHASGLVSVDISVLQRAAVWLVELQAADGTFQSVGKVLHQEMMGGAAGSKALSLTAYVTSALAKAKAEVADLTVPKLDQALQKAGSYLLSAQSPSTYTILLREQALALAGLRTNSAVAQSVLKSSSRGVGGRLFWTNAGEGVQGGQSSRSKYGGGVKTLDVEMTAYGVLALTSAGNLSHAFEGARWLLERRSALGGFRSTQDTVVALSALAAYATASGRNSDLVLKVANEAATKTVKIDASNIDVLQSMPFGTKPGSTLLEVEASGKGAALVMAEMSYNLPKTAFEPCYDVEVNWFGGDKENIVALQGCAVPRELCSWKNLEGMSIMSIGLFTGYAASQLSLQALKDAGVVKRFEISDERVDVYLDELKSSGATCVQFNVTKDFQVWNTQAAVSEFFEYYAPEARGESLARFEFKAMSSDILNAPGVAKPVDPVSPSPSPVASSCTHRYSGVRLWAIVSGMLLMMALAPYA